MKNKLELYLLPLHIRYMQLDCFLKYLEMKVNVKTILNKCIVVVLNIFPKITRKQQK
jgi:hypothetical protein